MGTVWLARHAPVTVAGICYGRLDVPTTCSAAVAADDIERAAGEARHAWRRIWTSSAARTKGVGVELAQRLRIPFHADERLCELGFGAWEGKSYAHLQREEPARFERWLRNYETEGPPGGESALALRHRVAAWLHERQLDGETVLAVTHAGVIRTARALSTGTGYDDQCGHPVEHLLPEAFPSYAPRMQRWVGTYRFLWDADLERFWRERVEAQTPDAPARDAALAEIRSEAGGAEIEITDGAIIASRSRGEEFYRTSLTFDGDTARFVKPNGAHVTLHLTGDEIAADEPGKPRMRFTRA